MKPIKKIGNYDLWSEIGKGQFGTVFQAEKIGEPDIKYACKSVQRSSLDKNKKIAELFKTEVKIMKGLNHPNILKCYDFLESGEHYYLVIKLCKDGDLQDYILRQKNGRLEESQAIFYLQQIMNGFKELGKNKIMHRDLKPANIFLDDETVVIGDFGMAKVGKYKTNTHQGTPQTMAPEILFTEENYTYTNKADLWSIGITFYMMLYGMSGPFPGNTIEQLKSSILKYSGSNIQFPDDIEVNDATKSLIKGLLTIDPEKRIEWKEFFGHEVFKSKRENDLNIDKMEQKRKSLYNSVYKDFYENTEYITNNPDFTFKGKRPEELLENKKVSKGGCCVVF